MFKIGFSLHYIKLLNWLTRHFPWPYFWVDSPAFEPDIVFISDTIMEHVKRVLKTFSKEMCCGLPTVNIW